MFVGNRLILLWIASLLLMTQAFECPNATDTVLVPSIDTSLYNYNVQVSLQGQNLTYDLFEFFDNSTQSLYRFVDVPQDSSYKHVVWTYDYKLKQMFSVEGTGNEKSCRVNDLSSDLDQKSLFHDNFSISDPGQSKYNFYWNQPYNATKQEGLEFGDGNVLDKYETCLLFNNSTVMYQVDVYFRTESQLSIPVFLSLNASRMDGNVTTSSVTNFEFSTYRSSEHRRVWSPSHPHGVVCEGRKDDPNITLPLGGRKLHMTSQESTDNSSPLSTDLYFDLDNKLSRVDINDETSYIMDYKQGLEFKRTADHCSVSAIPQTSPFNEIIADDVFLSSNKEIPELSSLNQYKYGGRADFQGSITHQYISTNKPDNGTGKIVHNSLYVTTEGKVVGVRHTTITGNETSESWVRISDFNKDVKLHHFDVTSCFSDQPSPDFTLQFSRDHLATVQHNFPAFKEALLDGISKFANVARLRLSDTIRFYVADDGDDKKPDPKLFVTFTIFPLFHFNGSSGVAQSNTTEAVKKLAQVIDNNEMKIRFKTFNNSTPVEVVAFPNYLVPETDLISGRVVPPKPIPPTGLSTAGAVGLAFGCLIVGMVAGGVLLLWRQRRSVTFNYSAFDTA